MQIESRIAKKRIPWWTAAACAVLRPLMILSEHARCSGLTLAALLAIAALPLHAQKSGEAVYETGTAPIAANTTAPMITTAEGLRFEAPTPLAIPYEKISRIEFRKDVREHLGFFPAMFAGMFFARIHIYRVALSYGDDAQKQHAAVFQLTRDDSIKLAELLRARAPACKSGSDCKLPWDE